MLERKCCRNKNFICCCNKNIHYIDCCYLGGFLPISQNQSLPGSLDSNGHEKPIGSCLAKRSQNFMKIPNYWLECWFYMKLRWLKRKSPTLAWHPARHPCIASRALLKGRSNTRVCKASMGSPCSASPGLSPLSEGCLFFCPLEVSLSWTVSKT